MKEETFLMKIMRKKKTADKTYG